MTQGSLLFLFLFEILLEFIDRVIQQEKEIKDKNKERSEITLICKQYDLVLKRP
jgi:hypothetical protein